MGARECSFPPSAPFSMPHHLLPLTPSVVVVIASIPPLVSICSALQAILSLDPPSTSRVHLAAGNQQQQSKPAQPPRAASSNNLCVVGRRDAIHQKQSWRTHSLHNNNMTTTPSLPLLLLQPLLN